jgi:hypothetical protein
MAPPKGPMLEELVRAYFSQQGLFALRGISLRFEADEVTDVDVWVYGRQSASVRTRTLVDVKNKRSPKALERILWARGMQLALGCDRAIVATTDNNPKVVRFAHQQKIAILTKEFLERLQKGIDIKGRLTLEEFTANIRSYKENKLDGDWLRRISDAKSALVSLHGYPAFNAAMSAFGFFAERSETRPQHKEQALRAAFLTAGLACIALDSALERIVYEDSHSRYKAIATGVTYGDAGDSKVQNSIDTVLSIIASGMENGRVVALQAREALNRLFEGVRADIIAEHFSREHNAAALFGAAKEFDDHAHKRDLTSASNLSMEAKSILGVFTDFVQAKRSAIFSDFKTLRPNTSPERTDITPGAEVPNARHSKKDRPDDSQETSDVSQENSNGTLEDDQKKLI